MSYATNNFHTFHHKLLYSPFFSLYTFNLESFLLFLSILSAYCATFLLWAGNSCRFSSSLLVFFILRDICDLKESEKPKRAVLILLLATLIGPEMT